MSDEEFSKLKPIEKEAYNLFIDLTKAENCDAGRFFNNTGYLVVQNSLLIASTDKQLNYTDREKDSVLLWQYGKDIPDTIKKELISNETGCDSVTFSRWISKNKHGTREIFENSKNQIAPYPSLSREDTIQIRISDFRPNYKCARKLLYSNSKYMRVIDDFIKNGDKISRQEGEARFSFIYKYLLLSHKHYLPSVFSEIWSIVFDKNIEYAFVSSNGSECLYHKLNGHWIYQTLFSIVEE